MKKQFLILFAFISGLALSQVPQRFNKVIVTGDITSPKFIKTGSTVDSVLLGNGSARSVNSLKTDTVSLSNRINTKEPLLPSTPSNPESRFLNGNKQWTEIVLGSGGYASNVYFTNLTSTIVGTYKQTSGTHELTEAIASGTCNNNEVLIYTYLFEQPVGITTVDAGVWRFTMNSKINSSIGDSKFKIVQFKRSSTGVETDMFTIYSNTIENTDYQNFIIETVQPSFLVDSLDRFGCRIYATTTTTVNKIISYKVGDGYASYLNTPLVPRHDQFRALNGNPNVQHLTAAQVAKVNNTSGINTGDETLTSIKTKLGAASSVSDGYLKYQDYVKFDGKLSSEVDGSTMNELQTISTTGAAGNITLSNSGGTLNLNVNDADASPTNEIQDLSLSGNMLTLSSDAPVDVSQATAVQANTAKVSNANHTGDVIGSTALTLATVNSSVGTFNNVTINAKGLATAGSNVSYEPSFSKNTAFNKNFGTTAGTVLEGRTFGTAANSAVGDFQPIENQRLSTTNSPSFNTISSTVATGTAPLTVSSTTVVRNFNADLLRGYSPDVFHRHLGNMTSNQDFNTIGIGISENEGSSSTNSPAGAYGTLNTISTSFYYGWQMYMESDGSLYNRSKQATNWQPWRKIYDSGNLTNNLTTNYLQKWNGSSMVNSLISDDTNSIIIHGAPSSAAETIFSSGQVLAKQYKLIGQIDGISNTGFSLKDMTNGVTSWYVDGNNNFIIPSTTQSISPTTGALVVGGGIGADHVRANNFYGNGSNLTGVQLPITLTTNGTSGAATFSGNVLNVPNYTSNATGGAYSPTITLLSGLASKSTPLALYTNIGSVKHAALSGTVTTNTTGTCSFRFTLPSSILGNNSIFHVYVFGYTGSYVADAYVTNYGSDSNVDLYFNSTSPSGSSFTYSIMVDYD